MKTVFIDPVCPEPAGWNALKTGALGGTEATLLRIAEGLARRGAEVTVAQHNRESTARSPAGVRFAPYDYQAARGPAPGADHVVVLRCFKILPKVRLQYPRARITLWMHCYPGRRWRKRFGPALRDADARVAAVSNAPRSEMIDLAGLSLPVEEAERRAITIWNPIDDGLAPDPDIPVDRDKLIFFSSPHKGLDEALRAFDAVRNRIPTMRLYLADPGYFPDGPRTLPAGVIQLGALPQDEAHRHVRESLCVFFPQTSFRETFGLVFAEANAIGTPVLAHPIGAAPEVLGPANPRQLVDCSNTDHVVAAIEKWRASRPIVRAVPGFRTQAVLDTWTAALGFHPHPPAPPRRLLSLSLPNRLPAH